MSGWRLVFGPDGPGPLQMGVDQAIQEARVAGRVPPTLRLYRFRPACVTIGRFQDPDEIDLATCATRGFDVARRPTGGRAVLHRDEVTYALVSAVSDGTPRGVAASYRHLSGMLVQAYAELGVGASLVARERGDARSAACYLHTTRADLAWGATKLSGSAQVWREDVCLQHGSVTQTRDMSLDADVFALGEKETEELAERTASLEEILGERPTDEAVRLALRRGAESAFSVEFEEAPLTSWEESRAAELACECDCLALREGTEGQGPV
jgi:lipoate-protein ligase A